MLPIFVVWTFLLTACQPAPAEVAQEPKHTYEASTQPAIDDEQTLPDTQELPGQTEEDLALPPNPFVTPLMEYFAGGVDLDGGSHIQVSRSAFWADITGRGDYGIVVIRHIPLDQPWYIAGYRQPTNVLTQARIFLFTGREVIYKDVADFREAMVTVSSSGRVIIDSTWEKYNWQFTLLDGATDLTTQTDVLIYALTVYREEFAEGEFNFYSFQGGFAEGLEGGRTPMTPRKSFLQLTRNMV